jgi:uracil-DNA glycosylase
MDMDNLSNRQHQIEVLRESVKNCQRCYLGQDHGPCEVFGDGPIGAQIMSISEAAGSEEQRLKKCYQGNAGKYWEGMLSIVGLKREDIYVTNAIKNRPMYDGKSNAISPDYEEVHACQPFLFRQLDILRPQLILVFGKVASYSLGLLKKSDAFASIFGKIIDYEYACTDGVKHQAKVVPIYHPSYLMRPNKDKYNWLSHLQLSKAKEVFNGLVHQ